MWATTFHPSHIKHVAKLWFCFTIGLIGKKFPASTKPLRFIAMYTKACHRTLSWISWNQLHLLRHAFHIRPPLPVTTHCTSNNSEGNSTYRELRSRIWHALKHSCRLVFLHYLPKSLGNSDICHSCFKPADWRKGNEIIKSSNSFSSVSQQPKNCCETHLPYRTHIRTCNKKISFDCFHINTQECLSRETWRPHAISMSNLATSVCCNKQNRNARLWLKDTRLHLNAHLFLLT